MANQNVIKVGAGRPSDNGIKYAFVNKGVTWADALKQMGITLDKKKEGIQDSESGDTVLFTATISDTQEVLILPGIDSNC